MTQTAFIVKALIAQQAIIPHHVLGGYWPASPHSLVVPVPEARQTSSSMIRLVVRFCDPLARDDFRCPCSSGGCLPFHKFRNGIPVKPQCRQQKRCTTCEQYEWIPKHWTDISETLFSWIEECRLSDVQIQEYLRDACRLEVFTRLEMPHTCSNMTVPSQVITEE